MNKELAAMIDAARAAYNARGCGDPDCCPAAHRQGEALQRLYDAANALEALSLLPPAQGWQEISSAPKDKQILGGSYHPIYGWLWDRADFHHFPALAIAEWIMKNGMMPTHWLALPAPPLPVDRETPEQQKNDEDLAARSRPRGQSGVGDIASENPVTPTSSPETEKP